MQTQTIQVKYVNQPKSPRGPGSVKDANGVYWKVWKDHLPMFQEGGTYTVGYETEQYQGKDQYTVKEVLPATASPATAPARQAAPSPPAGATPSPQNGSRDEQIFVCGIVNSAIKAGKLDPLSAADMAAVVKTAQAVFKAWHQ